MHSARVLLLAFSTFAAARPQGEGISLATPSLTLPDLSITSIVPRHASFATSQEVPVAQPTYVDKDLTFGVASSTSEVESRTSIASTTALTWTSHTSKVALSTPLASTIYASAPMKPVNWTQAAEMLEKNKTTHSYEAIPVSNALSNNTAKETHGNYAAKNSTAATDSQASWVTNTTRSANDLHDAVAPSANTSHATQLYARYTTLASGIAMPSGHVSVPSISTPMAGTLSNATTWPSGIVQQTTLSTAVATKLHNAMAKQAYATGSSPSSDSSTSAETSIPKVTLRRLTRKTPVPAA